MSNIFIKPAYFVVLTKNAPFLQLNSYFFHTMDLNCFKKKCDLFPCLDFRGDVFKARTLPQYLVFPVFFFFFLTDRCSIYICWSVSLLPCLTSSLSVRQTMLHFHLGIGNLEYLVLEEFIIEFCICHIWIIPHLLCAPDAASFSRYLDAE